MSETESKDITEQNVVITVDDCQNLKNYGQYFGVELSEGLVKALEDFTVEQSYANQRHVKREFCKWITTCDHETFKDPLWEKPQAKAQEFLPELELDNEIDKMLEQVDEETATEN